MGGESQYWYSLLMLPHCGLEAAVRRLHAGESRLMALFQHPALGLRRPWSPELFGCGLPDEDAGRAVLVVVCSAQP